NSGAAFANDFIEIFNRGSAPADLAGWTIQYASAAGTTWQATPLTGTVAPGRYVLVQLASGRAVGAPLPTPDVTGTPNLAASGGHAADLLGAGRTVLGRSAADRQGDGRGGRGRRRSAGALDRARAVDDQLRPRVPR